MLPKFKHNITMQLAGNNKVVKNTHYFISFHMVGCCSGWVVTEVKKDTLIMLYNQEL